MKQGILLEARSNQGDSGNKELSECGINPSMRELCDDA